MSQTNQSKSRETTSTQADIVKRLEELNRWQDEQQKLLQERQNVQRRQLGLEQRNMYQMLGLLHSDKVNADEDKDVYIINAVSSESKNSPLQNKLERTSEEEDDDEETQATHKTTSGYYTTSGAAEMPHELKEAAQSKRSFLRHSAGFKIDPKTLRLNADEDEDVYIINAVSSESKNSPLQNKLERTSEEEDDDEETQATHKTTSGYYTTSGAAEMPHELKEAAQSKRSFLRRGAGLKQRFKIDPETLRLNNLPRYKYANSHPKLSTQLQKRRRNIGIPPAVPQKPVPKTIKKTLVVNQDDPPLDAMEKRFQELLFSKTACNSTPDQKVLSASTSSGDGNCASSLTKKYFSESAPPKETQTEGVSDSQQTLPISWSKVLDSQQLRPLPVKEMRTKGILRHNEQIEADEENLSIFELLEKKANDGTIDMNSSYLKRFINNNSQDEEMGSMEIPVDNRIKKAVLQPMVKEVIFDADDANDAESESESNEENEEQHFKECSQPVPRVHVHFSEENDTREYVDEDTVSETSTLEAEEPTADETETTATTMDTLDRSDDLFKQFKEILFSALQNRVSEEDTAKESSNPINPPVDFQMPLLMPKTNSMPNTESSSSFPLPSITAKLFADDLQTQSNLIRERLADLEKEIAIFKSNNMELIKAKQAFELERAQFATEQQEACDRLKDEKIQMEIYLHDERMKFEGERAKLAEQMRRAKLNCKERKEIARLRQELNAVQLQLKEKEHNHASAQARLRTQIRNLERDQKAVYDDIERLNKENKRLQCENVKIGRENNNKMLQEINRNIAKLAPKLTTVTADEDFTPRPKAPFMTVAKSTSFRKNSIVTQIQKHSSPSNIINTPADCARSSSAHRNSKLKKSKINRNGTTSDSDLEEPHSTKYHDAADNDVMKNDDEENDYDDDVDTAKELQTLTSTNKNSEKTTDELFPSKKCENILMNTIETSSSANTIAAPTTNEFKREIVNADGSKDIWYPNGNLKKISADGMLIRMLYFNKDIKETSINEGTVKYYYAETNTWHTTYLDGLEILEFPNGQTEHRHKSGLVEVHFPNNSIKVTNPADSDVQEEWRFADGTNLTQMRNGDKIIKLPNGQKEIHTKLNKRREYPDGTVKLVYPDGSQETRYSNGRLRLKDKDGKLVMDTETASY